MKRVILGLGLASLVCGLASAQQSVRIQAQAVATCGSQSLTAGIFMPVFQDLTGTLCTASGGGGGGSATAANQTLQITQETAINTVLGLQANSTWDGSTAATLMSISRYQGVKLETIRALLAAPLAVTGTFWQATQPVSGSAAVGSPPTAPPLSISGVDGSGNKQHVKVATDGTVAVSAAALPLPTGAATQTTLASLLANTGSPFQAGGSIGNTAFGATQSGTWNIANISGTISLPTGAATAANQSTMATNQTAVQAPVAPGAATATKAELVGGQYNSAVQAFTNGQQGALQFDQRGGLLIQDGQAIPPVSVTSAATLFTVADTSGYGSVSVQITSAGSSCTITYETSEDGTTWLVAAGTPPSNIATSAMVTTSTTATQLNFNTYGKMFRARVSTYGSGTVTVQGTLRKDVMPRASVGIIGNVSVNGTIAEAGATGSGLLPVVVEGRTTNKTAVTTGQYVRPIATSIGAAVNKPFQVPELDWSYPAAAGGISNTTTAVTMVAAAGAGIRNYVTSCQLSSDALGAATEIAIRDGAAGTVIWRMKVGTAGIVNGIQLSFQSPIKSTANTLLEFVTLTASVTGAVFPNCQGYQAP